MKKKTRSARSKKDAAPQRPKSENRERFLSYIEYARHKGVTKQAVSKAIKCGRIRSTTIKGKPYIDIEEADRDWDNNTKSQYVPEITPVNRPVDPGDPDDDGSYDVDIDDNVDPDGITKETASEYRRVAEARKFVWDARQAQLDFMREAGSLVSVDQVKKEAFELARIIRDNVLNIPDRISAELVGVKDQAAMHGILTRELNLALQELSDRLSKQ